MLKPTILCSNVQEPNNYTKHICLLWVSTARWDIQKLFIFPFFSKVFQFYTKKEKEFFARGPLGGCVRMSRYSDLLSFISYNHKLNETNVMSITKRWIKCFVTGEPSPAHASSKRNSKFVKKIFSSFLATTFTTMIFFYVFHLKILLETLKKKLL